jgi:hypothetical protein
MESAAQHRADMATVHMFYSELLQEKLGRAVPIPEQVKIAIDGAQSAAEAKPLENWLALLDLAISAVMVRDALRDVTTKETAQGLLRYYFLKHSLEDSDRDKADFVVTFLYRFLNIPLRTVDQWTPEQSSPFEKELYSVLSVQEAPPLPDEHRQLVREFPFIRQEAEDIRHFDALMESGLMQRVRDIKQRFGYSFYHPRVLAIIAEYNVFIGNRFDELFRDAALSIKQFAVNVQQAGGSIMARVDGEITIQQLQEVEAKDILGQEYGRAQEDLRKVSKFKKAVDTRRHVPPPKTMASANALGRIAPGRLAGGGNVADIGKGLDRTAEEGKIKSAMESIRNFVLAADPNSANTYPMRDGNLRLIPAEVDAFRADFRGEKSFRGDFALALARCVAIYVRMLTEVEGFRSRLDSAYLWKPHADALAFLLSAANRLQEECASILEVAEARGLRDKVDGMNTSLQRLREQCIAVAKALEATNTAK